MEKIDLSPLLYFFLYFGRFGNPELKCFYVGSRLSDLRSIFSVNLRQFLRQNLMSPTSENVSSIFLKKNTFAIEFRKKHTKNNGEILSLRLSKITGRSLGAQRP